MDKVVGMKELLLELHSSLTKSSRLLICTMSALGIDKTPVKFLVARSVLLDALSDFPEDL